MQYIKYIIFMLLFMGYYSSLKRSAKIKEEFIPIFLISSISVVMYVAGILNILKLVTICIAIIGIILFFKNLYLIFKNKEKIRINFNHIILGISIVWLAFILKGTLLTHYDNFSHWGTIIKEMNITHMLPNFESKTIAFNSYPPGTACFVYFVCNFLGRSESIMLFAQGLMVLSALYTLFAFCDKNNKINYGIAILSIAYMLTANIFINQLLVDTVLSVLGIAVFAIIYFYHKDDESALKYTTPILILLAIVKNSGIFFTIIGIVSWLIIFIKNNGLKQIFKRKYVLLILLPILAMILWDAHTDLVFSNSAVTKHSMSVENYTKNLEGKEAEDITIILYKIKEKMLAMDDIGNQVLLISFCAYLLMLITAIKDRKTLIKILTLMLLFVATFIIYQIGVAGMYIFSMPKGEALNLAGYVRYFRTIVVFEYGITIISVLTFLNNKAISKKYILKTILCVSMLIPVILNHKSLNLLYSKQPNSEKTRRIIVDNKNTYNIESEKSYLVYLSDSSNLSKDYLYYICKYDFRSSNVKIINNFSELKSMDKISDYEYLIIVNRDEAMEEFLNTLKGETEANVIKLK